MRHVCFLRVVACGALFVPALVACSSSAVGNGTKRTAVAVRERDFRIVVRPARVPAGHVLLRVSNSGPADHELIVVRARSGPLPMRHDGLTLNEEAVERRTVATLEPASRSAMRTLDVKLRPGRYELFCNMAGHYLAGMRAFLVVT